MVKKKDGVTVFLNLLLDSKTKTWAWIKAIIFLTLALSYTFWALDFLPDLVAGPVGYVDDAIVWLLAAFAIRGAINTILDKKASFLGPIGKKRR